MRQAGTTMEARKRSAKKAPEIRIGISGWTYPPWRGVFFPKGWPQHRELEYASRQVNSIEINGSFYSLQRPKSYQKWYDSTPPEFVFSLKANRFITHIKRLRDVEVPLANFFASGPLCLREKLGPILWQLPPSFRYDREIIARFLELLPRNTREAAKLAHKHDIKGADRIWTEADKRRPLRHAMEIRHPSFKTEEFVKQLRAHKVALVVADSAGKWPLMEELTANFMYVRLHGHEKLYVSGYNKRALAHWKKKVLEWSRQVSAVYVYFDNDVKVYAPYDAMSLAYGLGIANAPSSGKPDTKKVPETVPRRWLSVSLNRQQAPVTTQ